MIYLVGYCCFTYIYILVDFLIFSLKSENKLERDFGCKNRLVFITIVYAPVFCPLAILSGRSAFKHSDDFYKKLYMLSYFKED